MSDETKKTPEQLEADRLAAEKANKPITDDAVADFVGDYLAETKPPPKKKKTDESGAAADDDDEGKPKPKPKPKAKPQADPQVNFERVAEAAGEGAARALAAERKREAEAAAAARQSAADDLGDAHKRKVRVLEQMEKLDQKYKGLAERYTKNLKALKEYADKWKVENPGEEFDEDDDEHQDFIADLEDQVAYSEEDYAEALAEIKISERQSKEPPKIDPEIEEIKLKHKREKRRADMVQARNEAGDHYWEQLGEEFQGIIKEDGSIDEDKLTAMHEADPVKMDEVMAAGRAIETLAQEAFLLGESLVEFNPENKAHATLSNFAYERESDMMSLSPKEQLDAEGRKFLPKNKFDKLPEAERDNYWTFTYKDINRMLAARMAAFARERIEQFETQLERTAKARGIALPNKGKTTPAPKPRSQPAARAADDDLDDDANEKPRSPTLQPEPRLAARKNKDSASPKSAIESWVDGAIG